ncbi:MAG: efflux RND transporter permease subunit, partial [Endomicrobiaceae bacterium]|nr:efflux RND transporter permease subunit [Endomicrobiaceae bacterium]
MNSEHEKIGIAGKIARAFIKTKLTPLLVLAALLLGVIAVVNLPREEEPQISVPMFDIFVPFPGASAKEVEDRLITVGERKLWEISGVEYVYSTAEANGAMFIVRFKVGTNMEEAMTRVFTKVSSNQDLLAVGAGTPIVKARSIDDVPILALTFWNDAGDVRSLRKAVASIQRDITSISNISETQIIGGHRRQFNIQVIPERLAEYQLGILQIAGTISATNTRLPAGHYTKGDNTIRVETDSFIKNAKDLEATVVSVSNGRPVLLGDVAKVIDSVDEKEQDVYMIDSSGGSLSESIAVPAVTLTVAKRKGANATIVADEVLRRLKIMVYNPNYNKLHYRVTRNYGETASEKSNELLYHMFLATISVTILIGLLLGVREALVVLVAIPVTLALTLLIYYVFGYTLNRITLFALIFSIGILVDDAIVVVENIHRHFLKDPSQPVWRSSIKAVDEVGNPTILATLTVIAAILPMAFVGGLMGPYMMPIPVGASFAMIFSLAVAFIVSPWLFSHILEFWKPKITKHAKQSRSWAICAYEGFMQSLMTKSKVRLWYFIVLGAVIFGVILLIPLKAVRMKMLPFDNKSEFQVVINMPEGSSLENTRKATISIADYLKTLPEVKNIQCYVGTSGPYNFNGLVRHYFLRNRTDQSDIQVNLVHASERKKQSHEIAKQVRGPIEVIANTFGARVHVAEVPPGPPVLSTLVIEIYDTDSAKLEYLSSEIIKILKETEDVVDIDTYIPRTQPLEILHVDRQKAALNGIVSSDIANTIGTAINGADITVAHIEGEPEPVNINLRLPPNRRNQLSVSSLQMSARNGQLLKIGAMTNMQPSTLDLPIYHKNLQKTAYVIAEVAGKSESPVYVILGLRSKIDKLAERTGIPIEQYFTRQPETPGKTAIKWDGE